MDQKCFLGRLRWAFGALTIVLLPSLLFAQPAEMRHPERRTLTFRGTQREYFVQLPPKFDRHKSYWPLVVIGGTNGRTFFLARGIAGVVADRSFDAIIVSPSFPNDDINLLRFPVLRESGFLEELLKALRSEYSLRPKILLTGYSRGGQFAHRYALAHPETVEAVAPFAAGTWTTPDGHFLAEGLGEVRDPRTFFSNAENASSLPERLRDLFDPKVAAVAASQAATGARSIPFLVMCGTLDPRLAIAQEFVRNLQTLGYNVAVEWPRTPHVCRDEACQREFGAEFQRYSRGAVEFFQRVSRVKVKVQKNR
jgi:pimeloyl-ACP methyl ester carboxylesterase